MPRITKKVGDRIAVGYYPDYGDNHAIRLCVRSGWNNSCEFIENVMSLEEARDLHYALGRIIDQQLKQEG